MSFDPSLTEQELLEDTLRRVATPMHRREAVATVLSIAGLAVSVTVLWSIAPPHAFALAPALICLFVLALSTTIPFDTPLGYTVPTQLAFVPLLFAMPLALVPIGVAAAFLLARLPTFVRGGIRPSRLPIQVSNAWFSVGPVAVLAIAHVEPGHAGPALLVAALAAQFVVDCAASSALIVGTREAGFSSLFSSTWVYGIDAGLSGLGLVIAKQMHETPLAPLALIPLLGLLAVFAHERRRRLESMLELSSAYRGTALVLGDVIEADDGYTGEHCKSVVSLAVELAAHLRLSPECQRNLEFAALLHDVGKIAIPKEIINKPGKLDPHEWRIIKTHTLEGQKMLDRVGGFMREVGKIVRSHHERWDGAGYPDGLAGEAIPLEARIISCCDTWNAMRTDRPYRSALAHDVAVAELTGSAGTQLDPNIVAALIELVASEVPAPAEEITPGAGGAPQPRLEFGYAHPAC
ncbi:MAG TPA: HD-GYP domain-containing protein [Solirubrobacteraceae bacterium]|nr:HD-GYP domain-containing protein [Solirubrobacteraceae bacterium]